MIPKLEHPETRLPTAFTHRGWMSLSLRPNGINYEMVVGKGDCRLTVWGRSVQECEKRARAMCRTP
jgi:hypothetical protein